MLAERVSYAIDGTQYGIAAQSQRLNPISLPTTNRYSVSLVYRIRTHVLQVNIVQASSVMVRSVLHLSKGTLTQI
jgi:hypothetical protein